MSEDDGDVKGTTTWRTTVVFGTHEDGNKLLAPWQSVPEAMRSRPLASTHIRDLNQGLSRSLIAIACAKNAAGIGQLARFYRALGNGGEGFRTAHL